MCFTGIYLYIAVNGGWMLSGKHGIFGCSTLSGHWAEKKYHSTTRLAPGFLFVHLRLDLFTGQLSSFLSPVSASCRVSTPAPPTLRYTAGLSRPADTRTWCQEAPVQSESKCQRNRWLISIPPRRNDIHHICVSTDSVKQCTTKTCLNFKQNTFQRVCVWQLDN